MMAEVPLAEYRGRVTAVFEDLREEFFFGVKTGGARVVEGATHADAVGVAARHECGAGGGADGLGHIETGEARALGGEAIDVRRLDIFGSVATEVAVAEVIGVDENNVRRRRGDRGGEQCGGRGDDREDEQNAELAGETAERKGGLHGPNVETGAAEASVDWGLKDVRARRSGVWGRNRGEVGRFFGIEPSHVSSVSGSEMFLLVIFLPSMRRVGPHRNEARGRTEG